MAEIHFKNAVGKISFDGGMSDEGKLIRKSKTYNNVAEAATPDELYQGLSALGNLSSLPLLDVEKVETSTIQR